MPDNMEMIPAIKSNMEVRKGRSTKTKTKTNKNPNITLKIRSGVPTLGFKFLIL